MPEITISDDKSRLDIGKIHHFLILSTQSTWAKGISLDIVRRSWQALVLKVIDTMLFMLSAG